MAEEKPTQSEKDARRKETREAVAAVPALYVDTWHIITWRGHLRITFGEELAEEDSYRTAIVMELGDAEKLASQLKRMIEQRKQKDSIQKDGEQD